jgi:CTP synthase (UTP-ammonia lyase)
MKDVVLLGDRNPEFLTHRALDAAIALFPPAVRARWVGTDTDDALHTTDADAVWVVPGTPYRNDDAVYSAITKARTSGQPFLATCGGFQYTVIEFARNVAGLTNAAHAETDPEAASAVIERLTCSLVAQERSVIAVPGTRLHDLCGGAPFIGFHWCNYGVAPEYLQRLTSHGLRVTATADDAGVEAMELADHPFFLATLFQPQIGALAGRPLHPVIQGFIEAVLQTDRRARRSVASQAC